MLIDPSQCSSLFSSAKPHRWNNDPTLSRFAEKELFYWAFPLDCRSWNCNWIPLERLDESFRTLLELQPDNVTGRLLLGFWSGLIHLMDIPGLCSPFQQMTQRWSLDLKVRDIARYLDFSRSLEVMVCCRMCICAVQPLTKFSLVDVSLIGVNELVFHEKAL